MLVGLIASAGCSYAPTRAGQQGTDAPPPDTLPATCENQGDHACDGRTRRTCGPDHQWLPDAEVCGFTCAAGECVDASNVDPADVLACDDTAPRLAPTSGTVTLTAPSGQIKVTCSDGCGDGLDEILATKVSGTPGLGWFCLSSLDLPNGVTMGIPKSGGPAEAIAFVVDGPISIAGTVAVDGTAATMGTAGEGAPGASDGGGPAADSGGAGVTATGSGGGSGGSVAGSANNFAAGGGGGGGFATDGGGGGVGQSPGGLTANGGGGGATFGAGLSPLVGGSGGGGGADGSCGGACGWPGGGGGGAIQLSSRASISITGKMSAHGGNGFGLANNAGGAGGGGAGGAFLFEAPSVTLAGAIVVDGGSGGRSGAGAGGTGASGGNGPTTGASGNANSEGGAGGGGAGGRVIVRAASPSCSMVSPAASCTTAALP